MNLDANEALTLVLERLLYLKRLRETTLELFVHEPGGKDRMRAGQVAAAVAARLDMNDGPNFRRDLTESLRKVGWRSVLVDNRRKWKGVRRR